MRQNLILKQVSLQLSLFSYKHEQEKRGASNLFQIHLFIRYNTVNIIYTFLVLRMIDSPRHILFYDKYFYKREINVFNNQIT